MNQYQQQAIGLYDSVDQHSISLRAARSAEILQALRDRKLERKAQRQQRRAARRGKNAYTTAV